MDNHDNDFEIIDIKEKSDKKSKKPSDSFIVAMIKLATVVIALGITVVVVITAVKGAGVFDNTKEKSVIHNTAGADETEASVTNDKFSITYEGIDGTTVYNPQYYSEDSEDFTLNNPRKEGYIFDGWMGGNLRGKTMEVVIPKGSRGDRIYTATWKEDPHAGETTAASSLAESKKSTNQTKAAVKKETKAGTKAETKAETKSETYIITLIPNGGKLASSKISVVYGENYILPVPTRDGYTFAGWYNGSVQYTGGKWTKKSNMTLSAKWNERKSSKGFTVYLDPNGGSCSKEKVSVTYGEKYQLPKPTYKGYTFKGWYDDEEVKYSLSGTWKKTANIYLYAVWEKEAEEKEESSTAEPTKQTKSESASSTSERETTDAEETNTSTEKTVTENTSSQESTEEVTQHSDSGEEDTTTEAGESEEPTSAASEEQ